MKIKTTQSHYVHSELKVIKHQLRAYTHTHLDYDRPTHLAMQIMLYLFALKLFLSLAHVGYWRRLIVLLT